MTEKKKPPKGHGWKPGQSGNPKGRPKGSGDVAQIRSAIAARVPDLLEHFLGKQPQAHIASLKEQRENNHD